MLSHRHWLKYKGSVSHISQTHRHLFALSLIGVPFIRFPPVASSLTCSCHHLQRHRHRWSGPDLNPWPLCSLEWNVWLLDKSDSKHRYSPLWPNIRHESEVHLRSTGRRAADGTAPVISTLVRSSAPASLSVTLFQEIWCPVLRALGVRQRVLSGWADGGQRKSLVTLRRLRRKTVSRTWTRSQIRLVKIGQLEAAVLERCEASRRSRWASWWACRRSERGQRDHSALLVHSTRTRGCLVNPTPNTVDEPKFCAYINEEPTPINLPDSNRSFPRLDDATIISTTGPRRISTFMSIQQQQAYRSKQSSPTVLGS